MNNLLLLTEKHLGLLTVDEKLRCEIQVLVERVNLDEESLQDKLNFLMDIQVKERCCPKSKVLKLMSDQKHLFTKNLKLDDSSDINYSKILKPKKRGTYILLLLLQTLLFYLHLLLCGLELDFV